MKLPSEKDQKTALEEVAKRRAILETSVQSVVQGYTPALFVWGPAGLGKSHVLCTMLDGMVGAGWKHHTAYSTAKGLMLSLAEDPNSIHLFEDCERMLKTDLSASLLRAACGAAEGRERWVTYETANETLKVNFKGGIVIATNANLARHSGPMQGVASRFRPMQWTLSLVERVAIILDISSRGWTKGKGKLSAGECHKVAVELIDMLETGGSDVDLDLRLFTEHALPTFAHCKATGAKNWQDVMQSKLHGIASTREEAQHEKSARLQSLAQLISQGAGTAAEKVRAWKERTGLGQAIYYRHLKKSKKV